MSTTLQPTKKGTKMKIVKQKGLNNPWLSYLKTKEEKDEYLKPRPLLSTHLFDWECVMQLGHEEKMKIYSHGVSSWSY